MPIRLQQLALVFTAVVGLVGCGENLTYPDKQGYDAGSVTPLSCLPNLDGRIDSAELQTAYRVPLRYDVNPVGTTRPFDLTGTADEHGRRVWDLSLDYADDQKASIEASALGSQWFASSFPTGQYVAPADLAGRILAIYTRTDTELLALGLASSAEVPAEGKTLIVYSQPVSLYRFPLEVGKTWTSSAEVRNATVRGLPFQGRDTYQITIDASGRLELPDVSFTQALRVRTKITQETSVGAPIIRRQVGYLFECFGEVARATAAENETSDTFTTAAELRRLGLSQ